MSLCIATAAGKVALAATSFILSWTHSVEHVEWREGWSVEPAGLVLREARVRGSGAGMEPPDGARLEAGWWVWAPSLPPQRKLLLAASGSTGAGWTLCAAGTCREIGADTGPPVTLSACAGE